jgi:hypothetical protein
MRYRIPNATRSLTWIAACLFACLCTAGCGGGGVSTSQMLPGPVTTSLPALVAVNQSTVNLSTSVATNAILRQPAAGASHVGVVIIHPFSDYSSFEACNDLAARGMTTLCVNTVWTNNEFGYYGFEQHAPAIAAAVRYLRSMSNISKVLLLGHSMGGPMMAFYENVAENGTSVCTGPEKIIPCVTTNLTGLPAADGLIIFDSHLGESLATYTYVDPAVQNNTLGQRDPTLDMFTSANGYNAATNGAAYAPTFISSFLAAQAARNAQLLTQAQSLLTNERTATGNAADLGDDIPFSVVGATAARLWQPDLQLLACTQNPVTLLSHNGTRPVQVVCSVRPPSGAGALTADSPKATLNVNVHIWLGAHSLRSTGTYNQTNNDLTGIDYTSTATSSVGNITGVSKPFLIVGNSGHYFIRPDEIIYQTARMADKTIAMEEGSVHGGTECTACETLLGLATPAPVASGSPPTYGYYGNTFGRTMDYMAEWIRQRY